MSEWADYLEVGLLISVLSDPRLKWQGKVQTAPAWDSQERIQSSVAAGSKMLARLSSGARRSAPAVHRLLSSMPSMPVNAEPQLIISVCGPHRAGALKDISAVIAAQGSSIASSKKVVIKDRFVCLIEVWCPTEEKAASLTKIGEAVSPLLPTLLLRAPTCLVRHDSRLCAHAGRSERHAL